MAYYDALVAKWATLTGSTQAKLDAINALTAPGPRKSVPVSTVMEYLRTNGLWLPIKAAAAAGTSQGAVAAVDYNEDARTQTINLDLPIVVAMLADLVSHSLLAQNQSDAIAALAATTLPWWQANGYPRAFDLGDIAAAGLS